MLEGRRANFACATQSGDLPKAATPAEQLL